MEKCGLKSNEEDTEMCNYLQNINNHIAEYMKSKKKYREGVIKELVASNTVEELHEFTTKKYRNE